MSKKVREEKPKIHYRIFIVMEGLTGSALARLEHYVTVEGLQEKEFTVEYWKKLLNNN